MRASSLSGWATNVSYRTSRYSRRCEDFRAATLHASQFRAFLITLFGAVAAFLQAQLGQDGLALAIFAAIAALVVVSYAVTAARGEVGMTTEVTALLAFVLGGLCGWGEEGIASAAAVAAAMSWPATTSLG